MHPTQKLQSCKPFVHTYTSVCVCQDLCLCQQNKVPSFYYIFCAYITVCQKCVYLSINYCVHKCACNIIVSAMMETGGASIQYTIDQTIEGEMCIECVFSDDSTEFCVVIVHETLACNTPPPCKQSLTNINASFKFARSGDKASGCIESVDSKFYQVGVIGGQPASGTSLSKGVHTS